MDTPTRPYVGILRAAKIAQVSRRTIYNWMRKGQVEYFRIASGSVRIYVDSLFKKEEIR